MKLTDLRIGDWVLFEGCLSKVISLSENVSQLESKDEDEYFASFNVGEDITPIPISKEILKKNGWEKIIESNDDAWYTAEYNEGLLLGNFYARGEKLLISIETGVNRVNKSPLRTIEYVHQLQHILWALGYNDDIVL